MARRIRRETDIITLNPPIERGRLPWEEQIRGRDYYSRTPNIPPGFEYEVTRPARDPDMRGDVQAPWVKTVITTIIMGTAVNLLVLAVTNHLWPWQWVLFIYAMLACCWWFVFLYNTGRDRQCSERWVHRAGPVQFEADILLEGATPEDVEEASAELGREAISLFTTFVRGCAIDTSMRRWEGYPGIGREKAKRWRALLIETDYAQWNTPGHERGGWSLVATPSLIVAKARYILSQK